MIREDSDFLPSMFKLLQDEDVPDSQKVDLAGFIRELCALSQTLQPVARDDFFRQLGGLGILSAIELLMGGDNLKLQRLAVDIFAHVVEHSPSMVRDFAKKEIVNENDNDDDVLLLNLVIEQMIYDPDPELGRATQVASLLRVLIDPESMLANKNEKSEFLAFFYRNCMHVMMAPLLASTAGDAPGKDDYHTAHLLSLILELLTFSVEHHSYNIKNYILNKDLLRRVLVLLRSRHLFLSLSALRFMRKIVAMSDEFYNRYIVKGDLFAPVIDALFSSGCRYNLLNSTILELFEHIRMENLKTLVSCIIERHNERLQSIKYTKIFSGIKLRYDQENCRGRSGGISPCTDLGTRFRRDARELDEEEELWFDKEDEGEFDSFEAPKINIDSVLGEVRGPANDGRIELPPSKNGVLSEQSALNEDMAKGDVGVKNGLVGLVDYPDDDSEEEDNGFIFSKEDNSLLASKKPSDGSLAPNKPSDSCISSKKSSDGSLASSKPSGGLIATKELSDDFTTSDKPTDRSIAFNLPNEDSIPSSTTSDNFIAADKPNDSLVVANEFSVGSLASNKLSDSSLAFNKPGDDSTASSESSDGSLGSNKPSDGLLTSNKPADGSIISDNPKEAVNPTRRKSQEIDGNADEPMAKKSRACKA